MSIECRTGGHGRCRFTKTLCDCWCHNKRGQTIAEYTLILAAIAAVAFASYQLMGVSIVTMTKRVTTEITSA